MPLSCEVTAGALIFRREAVYAEHLHKVGLLGHQSQHLKRWPAGNYSDRSTTTTQAPRGRRGGLLEGLASGGGRHGGRLEEEIKGTIKEDEHRIF